MIDATTSVFDALVAGDEVYVAGDYGRIGDILPIDRVTATQIIVGGCRYRRRNGHAVGGDSWRVGSIAIPNEGHRTAVRRRRAIDALRALTPIVDPRACKVTTENIEAAVVLLTPPKDHKEKT